MRVHPLLLAVFLALAITFPLSAAKKPPKTQENQTQAGQTQSAKVWTNDDVDHLRDQGLISIVGQQIQAPATQVASAPSEPSFPVYGSRLDDPTWYAARAADLQAVLDEREAALRQAQKDLALAADGITQPGINLAEGNPGITPESGIHVLQAQVDEVQNQLDALSDLARQNGILPGVLRGEPSA